MLFGTKRKYAARLHGELGATNVHDPGKCRVARLCNRMAEKAMPRCVALGHTRPIIRLTSKHYRVAKERAKHRGWSRYYRGCEKAQGYLAQPKRISRLAPRVTFGSNASSCYFQNHFHLAALTNSFILIIYMVS